MHEPLLNRIRELETANRRWKTVSAILGTMLLAVLLVGGGFITFYGYRSLRNQQAMEAAERARMMEMMMRQQAEAARQAADKAAQQQRPAEEKK